MPHRKVLPAEEIKHRMYNIFQHMPKDYWYVRGASELMEIESITGKIEYAEKLLQESEDVLETMDSNLHRARGYAELAKGCIAMGLLEDAKKYIEQGRVYAEKCGQREERERALARVLAVEIKYLRAMEDVEGIISMLNHRFELEYWSDYLFANAFQALLDLEEYEYVLNSVDSITEPYSKARVLSKLSRFDHTYVLPAIESAEKCSTEMKPRALAAVALNICGIDHARGIQCLEQAIKCTQHIQGRALYRAIDEIVEAMVAYGMDPASILELLPENYWKLRSLAHILRRHE